MSSSFTCRYVLDRNAILWDMNKTCLGMHTNSTNQNNPTQEEPEMSINSTMENINDAVLFHDLCLELYRK